MGRAEPEALVALFARRIEQGSDKGGSRNSGVIGSAATGARRQSVRAMPEGERMKLGGRPEEVVRPLLFSLWLLRMSVPLWHSEEANRTMSQQMQVVETWNGGRKRGMARS